MLPNGKQIADTSGLAQFENGVEFQPRSPDYKVTFSLEDADLDQLVRVIAQLTGKRFIFGGKVRNIKATVYSPQKVTVAEAYQAFLAILETNGLTVVPHGRFLKIVETAGIASQDTPFYPAGQAAPGEERYITRIHRLGHVSADEVKGVLDKFKTKEADITVYGPGNLLIITDTGSNIRRMMQLVEDIDVGGATDSVWIEPIHYASATDIASRVNDIFDVKAGSGGGGGGGKAPAGGAAPATSGESHIAKVIADDRSNSVVIVGREQAYLRILELIRRLDLPQTGEGELRVLPLQHADATELTKTLNEIITGAAQAGAPAPGGAGKSAAPEGIFEGRIKVSADKATNSIVVTASKRDYAELRSVVDRLDQARRQVFIEAVIMDLTVARSNQWGVNFHAGAAPSFGDAGQGLVYGGLNPLKTIGLPDPTSLQGMALGVRGPAIPGSDTLLGTGVTIPAFGVLLNALAHSEDTDVLSTPHILATDNVAAEINVGNNIPLQTNAGAGISGLAGAGATGAAGALGGLGSLGFGGGFAAPRQDVGTKIKVIPHLNSSNEVRLELTEEISEASATPVGALGTIAPREAHRPDDADGPRSADRRHRRPDAEPHVAQRGQDPDPRRHPRPRDALSPVEERPPEVEPDPRPHAVHHPRAAGSADGVRAEDAGAAGVSGPLLRLQRGARVQRAARLSAHERAPGGDPPGLPERGGAARPRRAHRAEGAQGARAEPASRAAGAARGARDRGGAGQRSGRRARGPRRTARAAQHQSARA